MEKLDIETFFQIEEKYIPFSEEENMVSLLRKVKTDYSISRREMCLRIKQEKVWFLSLML